MSRRAPVKSPVQTFALLFGMLYMLVGILGFVLAPDSGDKLFGVFQVNLLHNAIHLGIGAVFLFSSGSHERSKQVSLIIGIVYGVVAALGFANILVHDLIDANVPDDFLHMATAVLAVYFGTVGAEGGRPAMT